MAAGSWPTYETVQAQHRVMQLAARPAVHRAFHWLHLHERQMRAWQLEFLGIAAPSFAEQARARWFVERFTALGLATAQLDEAGNAVAELRAESTTGASSNTPVVLFSAHLDTVFAAGVPVVPIEDGERILGPGACDNGAGLAALLGISAALQFAGIQPQATILFAANVGEEGTGDLRGMRYLFEQSAYRTRLRAALALEGSGTGAAVTRALGSRRFRVTIDGPGGHSWADAAAPNPITLLARGLTALFAHPLLRMNGEGEGMRTTLSPGCIAGGTSINSIPESASCDLDLRSTDAGQINVLSLELHRTFEQTVAQAAREQTGGYPAASLRVESIGNRPAAELAADSPLMHSLRAVDRHLGIRTDLRLGSTDANLPLSLGVPAAALAAGGTGGNIHTLAEWYDPTGRETALRRILLTLLDVTGWVSNG
jgi:tripeptide aminopeptidase